MSSRTARPARSPTCWARSLTRLLQYAQGRGAHADEVLAQVRLQPDLLASLDARVTVSDYYRVCEVLSERLEDPHLGLHYIGDSRFTSIDAIGFLALSSATMGDALHRFVHFQALLSEGEEFQLEELAGRAVFRLSHRLPPSIGRDHVTEMYCAGVLTLIPHLTGEPLDVLALSFTHAPRGDLAEYRRCLGRVPEFGAPATEWAIPVDVLARPMRTADAALVDFFERYLGDRLQPGVGSVVSRVRAAISECLPTGDVSLTQVARRIQMSPRTLQRRLAELNQVFEALLDGVRQARAKAYLEMQLPLLEVSYLLGYADSAAFFRAFRRWTGTTPSSWRNQHPPKH